MLGSWTKIQGCYYVPKDLQLKEAGLIQANIYCEGNIKLSRTIVIGWLYAKGNIDLIRNVFVEGDIYAGRSIKLHKDITIEGDTYAGGVTKISPRSLVIGDSIRNFNGPWPSLPELTSDVYKPQSQPALSGIIQQA